MKIKKNRNKNCKKIEARCKKQGHLGPNESLEEVIENDKKLIDDLGLGYEEIANFLRFLVKLDHCHIKVISPSEKYKNQKSFDPCPEDCKILGAYPIDMVEKMREEQRSMDYLSPFNYVTKNLAVSTMRYWEHIECPHCLARGTAGQSVLLYNFEKKKAVHFIDILIHQIESHHFFRGEDSVYRLDPRDLVEVVDNKNLDLGEIIGKFKPVLHEKYEMCEGKKKGFYEFFYQLLNVYRDDRSISSNDRSRDDDDGR